MYYPYKKIKNRYVLRPAFAAAATMVIGGLFASPEIVYFIDEGITNTRPNNLAFQKACIPENYNLQEVTVTKSKALPGSLGFATSSEWKGEVPKHNIYMLSQKESELFEKFAADFESFLNRSRNTNSYFTLSTNGGHALTPIRTAVAILKANETYGNIHIIAEKIISGGMLIATAARDKTILYQNTTVVLPELIKASKTLEETMKKLLEDDTTDNDLKETLNLILETLKYFEESIRLNLSISQGSLDCYKFLSQLEDHTGITPKQYTQVFGGIVLNKAKPAEWSEVSKAWNQSSFRTPKKALQSLRKIAVSFADNIKFLRQEVWEMEIEQKNTVTGYTNSRYWREQDITPPPQEPE